MDSSRDSTTLLCESLKSELKAFERSFFEANGRKPGRADIKADRDIAPKYKEYGRLRDLLNGQAEPSSPKRKGDAHAPESQTPTKKVKTTKVHVATPSRTHGSKHATVATPSKHHKGQEEPQEAPLSATKIFNDSYMRSLLGPTPQKDGYVLGIFDLLPTATPSKERNVLGDIAANQTTPRKQDPRDESEDVWSGRRARLGRTPMSEGKRHYLDQFMSTPLKRKRDQEEQLTLSNKGAETPAFLRRDWRPMESLEEEPESPKMTKKPKVLMRSISTILQERRKEREEDARKAAEAAEQAEAAWQAQQHEDQDTDGDHDDELEAMRELEAEQTPMSATTKSTARRLFTSKAPAPPTVQPPEMSLGADGETNFSDEDDGESTASATHVTRTWKKRGAKRQTRRVIMRPVHSRSKPQPRLETIPSEDENDSDATCVPETQYNDVALANNSSDTVVQEDGRERNGSDMDNTAVEEEDSEFSEHEEKKTKSQHKSGKKPASNTKKEAKDKDGAAPAGNAVKRTARKISATAHANFCRLKIKNKNSKGKAGGGRSWGRNRR